MIRNLKRFDRLKYFPWIETDLSLNSHLHLFTKSIRPSRTGWFVAFVSWGIGEHHVIVTVPNAKHLVVDYYESSFDSAVLSLYLNAVIDIRYFDKDQSWRWK